MLTLRPYQKRIETAAEKNTIVVLPTGAGKTLIAAACALQVARPSSGPSRPTLFLVPTCILVAQQAAAIRDWSGLSVAEYTGGASLAPAFEVLVSTPSAFEAAMPRNSSRLSWASFGLVVFDEVHHVLKDHPYRKLAKGLRRSGANPRVLGLSASLIYAVGAKKVAAAVDRLCDDLRIETLESATVEDLVQGGYHASQLAADVREVNFPPLADSDAHLVPVAERRPHLLKATFFTRVRPGTATLFAARLVAAIYALEKAAKEELPEFESALKRLSPKEWGLYANRLGPRSARCAELEYWYEALRLIVISWEAAEDAATEFLRMSRVEAAGAAAWPASALAAKGAFWAGCASAHARFDNLLEVLRYKLDAAPAQQPFRAILFVEQRVMTHILAHVIAADPAFSCRVRSVCLYASSSPATPSLAISPSQAKEHLGDFSAGRANLLIATAAAEEGVDVAAANCVIRFDPMHHSVSFVQGRGRARQENSTFVVLAQREDRPVELLAEMEREQRRLVADMARARAEVPAEGVAAAAAADRKAKAENDVQLSRERGALRTLNSAAAKPNAFAASNVLNMLMTFCKQTKVDLVTSSRKQRTTGGHVEWSADLVYESVLRRVEAAAVAETPTAAKRLAAADILKALLEVA